MSDQARAMPQIEIQSVSSPTAVEQGQGRSIVIEAGSAARFDLAEAGQPIIVEPVPPGGGSVVLFRPDDLAVLPPEELAVGTRRYEGVMVLGVTDAATIYLPILMPLAELAADEGRRLVIRVGDA